MCVEDIACNISVVFLRHSVGGKESFFEQSLRATTHSSSLIVSLLLCAKIARFPCENFFTNTAIHKLFWHATK